MKLERLMELAGVPFYENARRLSEALISEALISEALISEAVTPWHELTKEELAAVKASVE